MVSKKNILKFFAERSLEITILIIAIIFFVDTYVGAWAQKAAQYFSPGGFSRFLVGLLILLVVLSLVVKKERKGYSEYLLNFPQTGIYILFVLSSMFLVYFIKKAGAIVACFIFLCSWFYILGYRSIVRLLILGIGGTLMIFVIFKITGVYL
jgi:hypothetical protein